MKLFPLVASVGLACVKSQDVPTMMPTMMPTIAPEVESVMYMDGAVELEGFKAVPSGASAMMKVPALIVVPDWDGLNWYEKKRTEMIADDLGYVGFAADIYGLEMNDKAFSNITLRGQLANLYRNDADLFLDRIQAAVNTVKAFPEVDADNVAIAGYCFGGTGVLMYGLLGRNDVKAIISFHGGLSQVLSQTPVPATPKILVLSGGEDDTSTDIMTLEKTLDNATADWEITRYSGIEHAFTVFTDRRYNPFVDMRSWYSMTEFLKEAFGETSFDYPAPESFAVETVPYTDVDGAELQGYFAVPDAKFMAPSPIVVILPDWDGVNTYEKQRATLLAQAGYIGFAADIYGKDLQENLDIPTRIEQTGKYRGNMELFVQRIEAAIMEAKKIPGGDVQNIAVIGYCFGGTGIIQLAFSGNSEVKAVVSFHGGLTSLPEPSVTVTPYTLILSGGVDDAHGNQTLLEEALDGASADWEITRYSGVDHGFTVWGGGAYSPKADFRSWDSMFSAFKEIMPEPMISEKKDKKKKKKKKKKKQKKNKMNRSGGLRTQATETDGSDPDCNKD